MIRLFISLLSIMFVSGGRLSLNQIVEVQKLLFVPGSCITAAELPDSTPEPELSFDHAPAPAANQVHGLYFYAQDCPHCLAALEEVIQPLQAKYGTSLDLRLLEIGDAKNYELLIKVEEYFNIDSENRQLPVLVMGEEVLIGEQAIRDSLPAMVEKGIGDGGVDWTVIGGLDAANLSPSGGFFNQPTAELCGPEDQSSCEAKAPIHLAFFFQVGCQSCSRVEAELKYLQSKYPQLIVTRFNIYENIDLADWLGSKMGEGNVAAPAVFVGNDALITEREINPQSLEDTIQKYIPSGAEKTWEDFDPKNMQANILDRFRSFGWMTIVLAGVVDGLNPCAFATLIFFVSYLTLSGKKGKEIIAVGGAFTLGVFLAYLAVGFGFYKVLELLGSWLTILGKWVYALTAIFCFVLAFFAFRDYLKARQGKIGDMELNLPHFLRMRINAIIRKSRNQRLYTAGAFVTGILISFLELACTGQIYLPTIIFMQSVPAMKLRATLYLLIYNTLFILPLAVVFILAYYGTSSRDLSRFLEKNAALVKLGMVILFVSLGIWLVVSVIG